jgi:hypothetical protein
MSTLNEFHEDFVGLIEGVKGNPTLEEWQHSYETVIYKIALIILQRHPELIVQERGPPRPDAPGQSKGPRPVPPPPGPAPGGGGALPFSPGQSKGPRPSLVLAGLALSSPDDAGCESPDP